MAGYSVRSLADLAAEAKSAFVQAVQGTAAKLSPNVWRVESKVLALLGFEHEQRRAYLYDQIFASRAARAWLIRHGFELGMTLRPASTAAGAILVQSRQGAVAPTGLRFVSRGQFYTALSGGTASGSLLALPVEADAAGPAGNLGAGFLMTLAPDQDVPAGIGPTATVDPAGITGGVEEETIEAFRARILARKRQPPQGGSAHDYATWAGEALGPGILRRATVGSFENNTRAVWLCFTVTDQPDGIPSDEQVALVQAYCDDPIRRPVTARVFVTAPIPLPVDIAIANLSPDTVEIRASIQVEIAATFIDRAEVGTGDAPATFSRSWIDEAISRATGEDSHELPVPASSPVATAGYLPVMGDVSYV